MPELPHQSDRPLPALYACHECCYIGPPADALAHEARTGHPQQRVSDEMAADVRAIWEDQGRSVIDGGPADA